MRGDVARRRRLVLRFLDDISDHSRILHRFATTPPGALLDAMVRSSQFHERLAAKRRARSDFREDRFPIEDKRPRLRRHVASRLPPVRAP
jgi:hypothetical protein